MYYICIPEFCSIYLKHTCVYITKLHGMQMVFTAFIKEMITSISGQRKVFSGTKVSKVRSLRYINLLFTWCKSNSFQFPIKWKFQDNPHRIELSMPYDTSFENHISTWLPNIPFLNSLHNGFTHLNCVSCLHLVLDFPT